MSASTKNDMVSKRTFWIACSFYLLIAFEFFYMATPFAVYFYSVYKPGLNFLSDSPAFSWLAGTFLPHIVPETKSAVLDIRNFAGLILAAAGFAGFVCGAVQVYYRKITKKGIAAGGIYKIIRHPQYLSLIICSLGLLVLWPRYLVLLSFITMLFIYYGLARIEERECEHKFGAEYSAYMNRTCMFLPVPHFISKWLSPGIRSKTLRLSAALFIYAASLTLAVITANNVKAWSLSNLYAVYNKNSAFISLNRIETEQLNKLISIALNDSGVRARLQKENAGTKYINYILPPDMFLMEIPMNPVKEGCRNHFLSRTEGNSIFKIVFTKAVPDRPGLYEGRDILLNVRKRIPLLEVTVDLSGGLVVIIADPAEKQDLANVPMPVY